MRSLIVVGPTAMIRYAREKGAASARWIKALLDKKPARLVSVAVANKTARIARALLVRKEAYRVPVRVAASSRISAPKDRKAFQFGKGDYGVM